MKIHFNRSIILGIPFLLLMVCRLDAKLPGGNEQTVLTETGKTIVETVSPEFVLMGYAALPGEGLLTTTGGSGGRVDTISTLERLLQMAEERENNNEAAIWYIKGKIESPETQTATIKHGANLTVIGYGANAELKNIGLRFWDYHNVIVRNLKIHEVLYPNDAITIDECHHVWIDHNELFSLIGEGIGVDTYDGLLDIKNGSRYVTVSWNYLHHHMKCSLVGHTDKTSQESLDIQFRITFHHNWFSYTDGRNPSLRYGAIHMFNNYFENISDYGIAVRLGAHALLENNHFESVQIPITTNKFSGSEGWICESGNIYSGTCSATDNSITQTDCEFWDEAELKYAYVLDAAEKVAVEVKQYCGVGILDTNQMNQIDTLPEIDTYLPSISMPLSGDKFLVVGPIPNPSVGNFRLQIYTRTSSGILISLCDLSGRIIQSKFGLSDFEGNLDIEFETSELTSGMYLLIIENQSVRMVKRLVIH